MDNPFSFETFQKILENDDLFSIDETLFYFDDEPESEQCHYLGCIRGYEKPYWVGYCDVPDGCDFSTAAELLDAKIYYGHSIKEKWNHLVFVTIGGIGIEDWLHYYGKKI